jgi:glyoxylase-like metal-dependent hydrolase (beta-lactamase superfamily II)
MAWRASKFLGGVGAVLLLLLVAAVAWMRAARSHWSDLVQVHNSVMHVHNSFTDFYGARVGLHAILFDAGVDTDGKALDALLGALKVGRDDVSNVFLTHAHFDHVAASPLCKKARIHVGIRDSDMLGQRAPMVPTVPRLLSHVLPVPAIEATDAFVDRGEIQFGDKKVLAIPFPGHTPGSVVLLFDGVLFAGDSMQISDGRLDFAPRLTSTDLEENKRSVAGLKAALQGQTVDMVCTGHQGCTPAGEAEKMLEDLYARAR